MEWLNNGDFSLVATGSGRLSAAVILKPYAKGYWWELLRFYDDMVTPEDDLAGGFCDTLDEAKAAAEDAMLKHEGVLMNTEAAYKRLSTDAIKSRNEAIVAKYNRDCTAPELAAEYGLAETTVRHIIANSRKHKRQAPEA